MEIKNQLGSIKITKVPEGEAPFEIRQAWVGLVLPCEPICGFAEGRDRGVLSGQEVRKRYSFGVPQEMALEILGKKYPEAMVWWKAHGFPQKDGHFAFGELEAEVIGGVTFQRIIEVSDEMQGDPNR